MRPSSKLSLPASVAILLLGLALLGTSTASSSPLAHLAVAGGSATITGKGEHWGKSAVVQCGRGNKGTRAIFKGATHSASDARTGTLTKTVNAGQPVTLKLLVTGGTGLRVRWTLAGPGRLRIKGCTAVWSGGSDTAYIDARSARDPEPASVTAKLTSFWTWAELFINRGGGGSSGGGSGGGGSGGGGSGGGGSGGGTCTVNYGYLSVSGFYDEFDVYLDGAFFGQAGFFNAPIPLGSHILSFYDYNGNFYKSVSINVNPCDSYSFS